MQQIKQQTIRWYGNARDLATDVAALFTPTQGEEFLRIFGELLASERTRAEKFLGQGFCEVKVAPAKYRSLIPTKPHNALRVLRLQLEDLGIAMEIYVEQDELDVAERARAHPNTETFFAHQTQRAAARDRIVALTQAIAAAARTIY